MILTYNPVERVLCLKSFGIWYNEIINAAWNFVRQYRFAEYSLGRMPNLCISDHTLLHLSELASFTPSLCFPARLSAYWNFPKNYLKNSYRHDECSGWLIMVSMPSYFLKLYSASMIALHGAFLLQDIDGICRPHTKRWRFVWCRLLRLQRLTNCWFLEENMIHNKWRIKALKLSQSDNCKYTCAINTLQ